MQFEVVLLAPAMEFIGSLEVKLKAKALRTIELLRHFGSQLPMPHSRKLTGNDLWELRVRYSSNICRLFYFHHKGMIYVVTSGYVKKSKRRAKWRSTERFELKNSSCEESGDEVYAI